MSKKRNYDNDEVIILKLNNIISKIKHFPKHREFVDLKETPLLRDITATGGLHKYARLMGYPPPKNINGYWNDITADYTIKKAIEYYGHFPKQEEVNIKYKGLLNYINTHGGINVFRRRYGYEPLFKPDGYWTIDTIKKHVDKIVGQTGHFPTENELSKLEKCDLIYGIKKIGGFKKCQDLLGYSQRCKPEGYWTEENTIEELKKIIEKIGHFPTQSELRKNRSSTIWKGMKENGGVNRFRILLGHPIIQQERNYWTEETIISELKKVIEEVGHFPVYTEIQSNGTCGLADNINLNGGVHRYAQILGYETNQLPKNYFIKKGISTSVEEMVRHFGYFPQKFELRDTIYNTLYVYLLKTNQIEHYRKKHNYNPDRKPEGYWNDDTILSELSAVIKEIHHFPNSIELGNIGKSDLKCQISRCSGFNKFRRILGYPVIKNDNNYWNDDIIIDELNTIIKKLGYFPTRSDFCNMDKTQLLNGINQCGGLLKFQQTMNIPCDYFKSYRTALASYVVKRGINTEKIIYDILYDYCELVGLNTPLKDKKFSDNSIIEFVCENNKVIGIDVTNCESKSVVYRKWTKKDYYKYLDELWIVVVSDSFNEEDYRKWNEESPENVFVMSIEEFCNELQYDLDESIKNKIEKYKSCTFHTRDKYKKEKQEADIVSAS